MRPPPTHLRLGGPDAGGTEGSPFSFLFCFVLCRQNGGSCCCLGASARPLGETVQDPPYYQQPTSPPLPPLPQKRPSLTHTYPSIHLQRQISWGCAVFCRCPRERADVQPEEERTFIVSVARQKRFLLPLRRSLQASVRVCVNNCLKREGDRPQLNSELFICICYKCKLIDIPLCSILFNADFLTQLPFTITDLKGQAEYTCGLLIVMKAGAGASQ